MDDAFREGNKAGMELDTTPPPIADAPLKVPAQEAPPLPTHSEDGIDLTLIRWMLSLTPLERLRAAQRYANSAQRLRNAPRRP